jgi:competence protein ComEC
LPGPRWFREGLAVTTGAQLAVAPVLVPVLGPMPLAALPANIAAGPLAGILMVWGLTAGTIAGVAGGTVAGLLHVPSGLGLWALERVAALGASLPLGVVDLRHVAAVALAGALASRVSGWGRAAAAGLLGAAVLAPMLTPVPQGELPAGYGATVWVDGPMAVVDVDARASPVDVLDALRSRHVAAVGLVVVRAARPTTAAVVEAIESRFPVGAVIGPPGLAVPDTVVPPDGFRAVVGRLEVMVDRAGPPLRVRIGWARVDERGRR